MAEMTAAQAIDVLRLCRFLASGELEAMQLRKVSALIEQQSQEIERLNGCLKFEQNYLSRVGTHGPDCYKWGPGHWNCAMQEIDRAKTTIDTHSELAEHYKQRAEQAEAECKRLRVCCNCRHFEWPKCTVSGKRTTRASICRDWEMV